MTTSNFSISDWLGVSFEVLTPLILIAALLAFGVGLWPAGILHVPLAQIPLYAGIAVAGSILMTVLGLTGLYLLAVEQFSRMREALRRGIAE